MLLVLALVLGPFLAAALLSLIGPRSAYVGRLRILSMAVGAAALVAALVVHAATDAPSIDGLLHLRHAITLHEGAEDSVPFDVNRPCRFGCEVEVHLDESLSSARWQPLEHLSSSLDGPPLATPRIGWSVRRDGAEIARRTEPARLRRGLGWTTDGPLVALGRTPCDEEGRYELRWKIERLPTVLRGERAHLAIDSDVTVYKSAVGRRSVRNMAYVLLGVSATMTMLLGLLAFWMRPREASRDS